VATDPLFVRSATSPLTVATIRLRSSSPGAVVRPKRGGNVISPPSSCTSGIPLGRQTYSTSLRPIRLTIGYLDRSRRGCARGNGGDADRGYVRGAYVGSDPDARVRF